MKEKQTACVIVFLLAFAMGYGMKKFHATLVERQAEARAAEAEARTEENLRENTEKQLAVLKMGTRSLRDYFDQWLPHLGSAGAVEKEEQKIFDLIKSAQIFASSQRTEVKAASGDKEAFIPQKLSAHLVIQDNYTKTMNWMGSLEEALPSCRIANIKLTRGVSRNDVQVEVTIDFPLIASGNS
ncbi:MAG: hypothetical protein AAGD22_11330 [Verrucomicrobiota bacterium]